MYTEVNYSAICQNIDHCWFSFGVGGLCGWLDDIRFRSNPFVSITFHFFICAYTQLHSYLRFSLFLLICIACQISPKTSPISLLFSPLPIKVRPRIHVCRSVDRNSVWPMHQSDADTDISQKAESPCNWVKLVYLIKHIRLLAPTIHFIHGKTSRCPHRHTQTHMHMISPINFRSAKRVLCHYF